VSLSDGKVILVGHSAGGMTISAVAEQVPNLLLAVVYLAGFMAPNGMPLLAMLQHETFSSALAPGLFVGDPAAIGATRINAGSTDEAYRSLLKAAFYGDVSGVRIRACGVATSLRRIERRRLGPIGNHAWKIWHGAAPLHPLHTGSRDSVDRSGSHDRHGRRPIGGKTTTHTLESSHSPFLSQPAALSKILIDICVQSLAAQSAEAP